MDIRLEMKLYNSIGEEIVVKEIKENSLICLKTHNVKIRYDVGRKKLDEIKKETIFVDKEKDIGRKWFFNRLDGTKSISELLEDDNYEKYKENIILKQQYEEEVKQNEIKEKEKNAPRVKCSDNTFEKIIKEYSNEEKNLKEEKSIYNRFPGKYFARMDTKTEYFNEDYYDKFYLSKNYIDDKDFTKEEKNYLKENNINFIDWRSSLGNLYYDTQNREIKVTNEKNSYEYKYSPLLKRAFSFNPLRYSNTYISNSSEYGKDDIDPFLIEVLKQKRNDKNLTDIIASIRDNQNNIIRTNVNENFVVQGCAGSGKTMILLHRLSYLKFNNYLPLDNRIKIITPNNIFKNFIKELTTSLDIENIEQITIENYMKNLNSLYRQNYKFSTLGIEVPSKIKGLVLKDKDYFGKLENYFDENELSKFTIDELYSDYNLKELKAFYESYLGDIVKRVKKEFKIEDDAISNKELFDIAIKKYPFIKEKYEKQIKIYKEIISNNENNIRKIELNEIDKEEKENIEIQLGGLAFDDFENEEVIQLIVNKNIEYKLLIKKFEIKNESISNIYDEILKYYLSSSIYSEFMLDIKDRYYPREYQKKYCKIDLLYYLYINYLHMGSLIGQDELLCFDEAQDYSILEYAILKKVLGDKVVLNLYGDINQSSFSKGIRNWKNLIKKIPLKEYFINENYRNTEEITKFVNDKLKLEVISMGLHGNEVKYIKSQMIAIILEECKKNNKKVAIISNNFSNDEIINDDILTTGRVEDVKGIEYDTVIVDTDEMKKTEKYISFTRALNNLYIIKDNDFSISVLENILELNNK